MPTDDELGALALVARAGIHPPDEMPLAVPWSTLPSPAFERGFVQFHWTMRATWRPEDWMLNLGVFLDGQPIGSQSVIGRQFAIFRTLTTSSWLGLSYQGRGYGKEMRSAVLAFGFDHLGAVRADTEAFIDNVRSAGVSRSLGYVEDGLGQLAPQGVARPTQRFRMTLEQWRAGPRRPVEVVGLDACRDLFGAT
ncbi:MAG: GNAT family N-acetyltransferase [Chloroflexi bacterium]|nr:GNAT family N-acetyltransferase [Chloroflexota bacterium]